MSKSDMAGGRKRSRCSMGMDRSASAMKRYRPRALSIPPLTAEPLPWWLRLTSRMLGLRSAAASASFAVPSSLPSSATTTSQE